MAVILIADDEAHITRVLSLWLQQHGYEVLEARDGAAALEMIRARPVDVIVSDMNMPRLDGLGLVRAVREELQQSTPIILLSARCDQASLAKELEAYDVKLYPKPFMPSRLVAHIESLLDGAAVKPV